PPFMPRRRWPGAALSGIDRTNPTSAILFFVFAYICTHSATPQRRWEILIGALSIPPTRNEAPMPDPTASPDPLDAKLDVNLRVADLEASVDWYARVFGCEPIYRGVDRTLKGAATSMACFRLGGVKIWLLPQRE